MLQATKHVHAFTSWLQVPPHALRSWPARAPWALWAATSVAAIDAAGDGSAAERSTLHVYACAHKNTTNTVC